MRALRLQQRIIKQRGVPSTVWSFAPNRVPEHPSIVLGSYIQEPLLGLGSLELPESPAEQEHARNVLEAMVQRRGYTLVPSRDMQEYFKMQAMTMAVGFTVGLSLGAVLGPAALSFFKR
jgi:hypothetical protein